MQLTNLQKFIIIAFAFVANVMLWIWTGIKVDALALGMNEHVFNIGLTAISGGVTAAGSLLVYLGLKAPTLESRREDAGDGS